MTTRILFGALLLVASAGCDLPTTLRGPDGATPFDPPAMYDDWADEVRSAGSLGRSIGRVRWYVVPGDYWFVEGSSKKTIGQWFSDGRIYIAAPWLQDEGLIKHEILHELLRGDTDHKHPLFAIYQEGAF